MIAKVKNYRILQRRNVAFLATMLLSFIAIESFNLLQVHQKNKSAQVMNMAGRQRMISQRIASKALQGDDIDIQQLSNTLARNHRYLVEGGGPDELPPAFSIELMQSYDDLDTVVFDIKNQVDCLMVDCRERAAVVKKIIHNTEAFLPKMDAIVYATADLIKAEEQKMFQWRMALMGLFVLLVGGVFLGFVLPQGRRLLSAMLHTENQKKSVNLIESVANIGSWEWDITNNEKIWSDEIYRIHGLPVGSQIDHIDGVHFYADSDQERVRTAIQNALEKRQKIDSEYEFVDASGIKKWVRVIGQPVVDEYGKILRLVGVMQDISDRKLKERELLHSKKYLELAMEGASLGIWDWYLKDNTVVFDRRWCEMLGLDHATTDMSLSTWESRVHPDDLASCYKDIQAYLDGKTETYNNIHRMKHTSGEWVYILDQGKVSEYDEKGQPIRFTGTHLDITQSQLILKKDRLIAEIRKNFFHYKDHKEKLFQYLVEKIATCTDCEFGFITDFARDEKHKKRQIDMRLENLVWGGKDRSIYVAKNKKYIEDKHILSLISSVRDSGETSMYVMSNNISVSDVSSSTKLETQTLMGIPLNQGGNTIGVLALGSRENGFDKGFLDEFMPVVETVSEIIAIFQLEQEAKNQAEQTKMILAGVQMGVYRFYPKERVTIWDDSMFKVYGLDPESFKPTTENWQSLVEEEDGEMVREAFNRYLLGDSPEFDVVFRLKPDERNFVRYMRTRANVIRNSKGHIEQVVGVNLDVTSEVEARGELEQQKKLSQRNARLASIGVLAAGVGHEINNPLAIAKGYLETMRLRQRGGKLQLEQVVDYLNKMETAMDRIAKIVSGLRTFSKVDIKSKKVLNVRSTVEETIAVVKEIYAKEGIEVELVDESGGSLAQKGVVGSRGAFQQIVLNLLSNAKDAVRDSKNKKITIYLKIVGEEFHLEVKDSGQGIDSNILDKIFDPFFTTKKVNEGSGIGLSLVHNILEEMNGSIKVAKSGINEGTVFQVVIPAIEREEVAAGEGVSLAERLKGVSAKKPLFHGKKALVVDDEKDIASVLGEFLKDLGFQVECCYRSEAALQKLMQNPLSYHLVVSDMQMPDMNGLELKGRFDSLTKAMTKKPKWLVLTGGVKEDLASLLTSQVIDGYLYKPFSASDVESTILEVFLSKDDQKAS